MSSSRSIPYLGVDFDVDNGGLGLDFDDDSSPSDTDDSELKKKGRLHILYALCIIPCAKYSTANRLVFHSASRQPLLPHYQSLQPAHAHHRLSTQRQQSSPDIRSSDSGISGASAPPSAKSHPLQLDTTLMNPCVSRAASTPAP